MDTLEQSMIMPAGEWVEKDPSPVSNNGPTPSNSGPSSPYVRSTLPSAITGPDSARQFYGTGQLTQRFMQPMATNSAATVAPSNSQAKTEALRLVSSLTMDNISNGQAYSKISSNQVDDNGTIIDLAKFQGQWSSTVTYQEGNEVEYQNYIWAAAQENTNSAPTRTNVTWQVIGPTSLQNFQGSYNSGNSYNPGDEVAFNGFVWQALIAVPTGQTPPSSGPSNTYWKQVAPASHQDFVGNWNSTTFYYSGQIVDYNGNDYKALQDNSSEQPDTHPTFWSLLGPDTLDRLADGSTYKKPVGVNSSGQTTTPTYSGNSISGFYQATNPTSTATTQGSPGVQMCSISIPAITTGTPGYLIQYSFLVRGITSSANFTVNFTVDGSSINQYTADITDGSGNNFDIQDCIVTVPFVFYSANNSSHTVAVSVWNNTNPVNFPVTIASSYLSVLVLKA